MLFMIGLEIDLKKIIRAGNVILVTSAAQIFGCFALGLGLFLLIGIPLGDGRFDALYLAAAVALSSTVIIVKVLYDKLELDTLPGRITLGVLVVQDLFAILFLAIQPSLNDLQFDVAAAFGAARRRAAGGGAADQPLHAAASVPADRASAGAGAGRRAGLVLRRRRVCRIPRPVARDGRADRRRFAFDLPLRARRHRQGHVAARFLHHAVLRGAGHDDPGADAARCSGLRSDSGRVHAGRAGS